jgi:hypothetical protein
LRRAARLLSAYGVVSGDPSFRPIVLITRLAALAEAVAALRQAQDRAAQADGALRAAERLRAAEGPYRMPTAESRRAARSAAALADAGFPVAAGPVADNGADAARPAPGTGASPGSPRPGRR